MRTLIVLAIVLLAGSCALPAAEAARCSWRPAPGYEFECEGKHCAPGVGVTPGGQPFVGCAAWD